MKELSLNDMRGVFPSAFPAPALLTWGSVLLFSGSGSEKIRCCSVLLFSGFRVQFFCLSFSFFFFVWVLVFFLLFFVGFWVSFLFWGSSPPIFRANFSHLGFGVPGVGLRIWGLGFGVQGLG